MNSHIPPTYELPGTVPDEIRRLNPRTLTLRRSKAGKLVLSMVDATHDDIRPALAHPLTNPTHYIFLIDSSDKTIGYIESLNDLDDVSREALEQELHFHYYSTTIHSISKVTSRHGITTWSMLTEQGPRTVHVKDRGDIRHLHSGAVIFTDAYGMKFVIPDRHKLDPTSIMFLESES